MKLRVLLRLVRIQRTLVRHGLTDFTAGTPLYRPLQLLRLLSPWTWLQRDSQGSRGARLRLALEELGPVFVKFGQAVSTRRDLLPPDIADELVKLQDAVPPFDGAVAQQLVVDALAKPLAEVFSQFDVTPLAAASIAQVHVATLLDGSEVVVKVLRPGMRERIGQDLEVMYALAGLVDRWSTEGRRLRPLDVVREYERTILDELDLLREAANATQLKRNFEGSSLLHVPVVHWPLCRDNVMVMERIRGIQIGEVARLRELGTDMRKLSESGVAIFFTQVFRHNFFHADMHPGNIFVLADDPANPRYAAVDFGIIGTLDPRDRNYLAENFLAVFRRDYRKVATLHIESGWVPATARVDEMESAIRTICEPIFDKPLKDISFGVVLLRLFEALRRFDGRIQPQLILLQKTLFNIEGLGRQLYPDLDIWKTANPILVEWMREQRHPVAVAKRLWKHMPDVLGALEGLPAALRYAVESRSKPQFSPDARQQAIEPARARRDGAALVSASVTLLAGIIGIGLDLPLALGWILGAGGGVWLLREAFKPR
ncbi:MAG: ubiquinone biosynthesis regulatory protein kinase UbiB [Proteobacteria bacterium]|nr:ubiquinone biosynthesis regulatory protein kinase UbiB [Pseudomonadota bacterium]